MSRYIDFEIAREYLHKACECLGSNGGMMLKIRFDEEPKADVVEVVRCKDCKWLDTYTINGEDITACNNENAFFRDVRCDEHCSCGERREDGE